MSSKKRVSEENFDRKLSVGTTQNSKFRTQNVNCYFFLFERQTNHFLLYFCAKFRTIFLP